MLNLNAVQYMQLFVCLNVLWNVAKRVWGSNHLGHVSFTFLCIFYPFISLKHYGQKWK